MQRLCLAFVTFGIATLSNAIVIPRQSVALVVCDDVLKPNGHDTDGLCNPMVSATNHCLNQFMGLVKGGTWLQNPKSVVIDAPEQYCMFFEDGYCDFDNYDKLRFVYGPRTSANISTNFGEVAVNSIICFFTGNDGFNDSLRPLVRPTNHSQRRAIAGSSSAEVSDDLVKIDAQRSARIADEESLPERNAVDEDSDAVAK